MKKRILFGIGLVFTLSACQTNQVKLSKEEASDAYFACLNQNYYAAMAQGLPAGEKSIDSAIDACENDAMNYAMVFARKYHQKIEKHYEHASMTYKPIIQKTAKNELLVLLSDKN